jgi:phosphatidylglycerophosphatase A
MKPHPFNLKNPVHLLALGFGSGLLKPAPGTWGTLAAVPFYFMLAQLALPVYVAVTVLAFVAGIYFCGKTARDIGTHDHGSIVWDEFVGLWIALAVIPATNSYYWVGAGFLFFRFFDIVKPFPIGLLDKKVHGGFGIMLDDAIAGLYAMACLLIAEEACNYYMPGV